MTSQGLVMFVLRIAMINQLILCQASEFGSVLDEGCFNGHSEVTGPKWMVN